MNLALLEPLAPEDFAAAVDRLVVTRWLAAGLVGALTLACVHVLGVPLPAGPLVLLAGAMAAYNALLALLAAALQRRLAGAPKEARLGWSRRLVVLQVGLDWLAVTAFVHFTGGVTSPALPLYLVHLLVVTVLAPMPSPLFYLAMATTALAAVAGLENVGALAHHRVLPLPATLHQDPRFILAQLAFFTVAGFGSVHMAKLVVDRLRERDRQLAAMLAATRAATSSLDVEEVLDRLVESAARALSAKAAAIRLLDQASERMEVIAATGLSERFLNRGFLRTASRTDREALAGGPVFVSDALHDPRVQCLEEVEAEGIRSVLVVALAGRNGRQGVLRVYSDRPNFFAPEDVAVAQAIAVQGATALDNALAHAELQKAEAARGQFVLTVTESLRAPLAGSVSLVHVLLDGVTGELAPEQRTLLGRIGARLASLAELVNDLLALAATGAAQLEGKPVLLDLTSAVRRAVEQLGAEATAKGVALALEAPEAPVVVRATDQGLSRVFGNLAGNALKYTPSGGKVQVRVSPQSGSVEVSVADTGMGIPAEDVPRLFREFFRAGNAKTSKITGTGLGLAIVKRLVTSYGGTIGVRSEEGRGTTFTVLLPLGTTTASP